MIIHSPAIVIHSLRYGENDLIVSLFTRTNGLRSYLIRGVLKSRKGKLRSSLFQPLTLLEIEAYHKDKGTLERIREAKILIPYTSLHLDVSKNALVFFIAEILKNAIKEEETNESLFDFLQTSLLWLEEHQKIANFHIAFLVKLTQFLGFYPDLSSIHLRVFNLEEGCFQSQDYGMFCRDGEAVEVLKRFLGITFDESMCIKMTRDLRNEILGMLLSYFELHLHGFRKPKSLAVLNQIFT